MKILIAEDDAVSALLLERTLKHGGYEVSVTRNGAEALEAAGRERFDALLTDWMMPQIDGMELTRRVRAMIDPQPLIIVITALASEEARIHALAAGADAYLAKPVQPRQVLDCLANCIERKRQPLPVPPVERVVASAAEPPFVGVVVAASTGGPQALLEIVRRLPRAANAAYFVVLHGPRWVIETLVSALQRETPLPVQSPEPGTRVRAGSIYVAPSGRHMLVTPDDFRIDLSHDPPENFVRPAADPLFRSAARCFGRSCLALVLTGMGRDASLGAAAVAAAGGSVLVQDPESAIAPSMPRTVGDLGVAKGVFALDALPAALDVEIQSLAERLAATPQ